MSVVNATGLEKGFGAFTVFTGVDFALAWGERAGLVGPNGVGKTTLLEILAGRSRPDRGRVSVARGARAGYLTQDPELPAGTVHAAALDAFRELAELERQLAELGARMAEGPVPEGTLAAFGELQARFEHAGGYDREHTAEATLRGLGLPPELWELPVDRLSGGQRVRLGLCRLLLSAPDLLLADEPTNHLDAAGIEWLEQRLVRWDGALLLVSHDRYFLDRVATRVLELTPQGVQSYPGNYSAYVRLRAERAVQAEEERARAQAEEERLQAFVDRYRAGNLARQARSRQHRLDRLRQNQPTAGPAELRASDLRLDPRGASGREVLSVEGLAKGYGGRRLFGPWEAIVRRGERVGIVGENGAGKTTLLRILAGEEAADGGGAYWGHGVEVSWLRQDMAGLDDEATVLENVLDAGAELGAAEARNLLARFLFRGDTVFRRVGDLSGGERNRLLLCLLTLERANVLLCDEPTNHLDIPNREALEQALAGFSGTLLVVSHDRYLLERLCTRVWWLHDGRVEDIPGGYAAYLAARQGQSTPPPDPEVKPSRPAPRSDREARRRQARLNDIEQRIASAEEAVERLGARLAEPALYQEGGVAAQVVRDYERAKAELEALYADWEREADAQARAQESTAPSRSP